MASNLKLQSGSVFNGNPIVFMVRHVTPEGSPSFHRMIFEVKCGMKENYETIKMSEPIVNEKAVAVMGDISSALRSFRDSYKYTPEPGVMPVVKFNVSAYDEYMIDGELHKTEPVFYLSGDEVKQTLFGGFSDYDRRMATNDTMAVSRMTRKPTSSPQLVCRRNYYLRRPILSGYRLYYRIMERARSQGFHYNQRRTADHRRHQCLRYAADRSRASHGVPLYQFVRCIGECQCAKSV